ncbi:hypothetical protein OAC11_06165 [Alphaproteobacteria bacterium]|jgi:hypothetical protein|nr:hypothetical protein [Alphaproteobacteria bacterium]
MKFKQIFDFSKKPSLIIGEELAARLILLKKLDILENNVRLKNNE